MFLHQTFLSKVLRLSPNLKHCELKSEMTSVQKQQHSNSRFWTWYESWDADAPSYPDAKSGDAGCFDSDVRGWMVRTRADAGEVSPWSQLPCPLSWYRHTGGGGGPSDQLGTCETGNINAPVPSVTQLSSAQPAAIVVNINTRTVNSRDNWE